MGRVLYRFAVVLFVVAGCANSGAPIFGGDIPVEPPGHSGAGATSGGGQGGKAGSIGSAGAKPPTAGMGMAGRGVAGMDMAGRGMAGVGGSAGSMMPMAGMGAGGGVAPTPPGSTNPTIPAVTGECPAFRSGTISFMGLGGIDLQAGPKASSPSAPMVFYWHGTGSSSGEYVGLASNVYQGVMAEGGVLISFQNTTGGDFNSGTAIFGAGDWDLTDQLLACAVRDHNIDPRRVFATGCSAGGLFSTAMAASRSSYMAAVAPNSGGFTFPSAFQTEWTPALMTIHGAPGVDVVGIDFSESSKTADMSFKGRGGFVINCNHGGPHCGGGGLAPDIWEFFKAHPYGTKPSPWASALPAGFNSVCEIYQ